MIQSPDTNSSQTYFILGNLLQLLEQFGVKEYGICDSGATLEISPRLFEKIQHSSEFQAFRNIHGSWILTPEKDWYYEPEEFDWVA